MSRQNSVPRRDFLQSALASLAGGAVALPAAQRPEGRRERAPNILVLMSDEHNHKIAGCYGNPLVRTPNLDRLAEGGITFDGAYCNSPLCVPSRLSFTSGKYIHRVGAWNNDCRLPSDDYPSLPHVLNAAGYESYLCGKQHYDTRHRYGFTEIGGNMNNGRMTGRGGRRRADDTTVNIRAGQQRFESFHAGEDSGVISHDRKVTAGVLDFLSKRTRSEKPFFLFAGYLAPHFPLTVPESYWAHYRDKVPMPQIPPGFLDRMPLNYKHLRRGFGTVDVPADVVKRGRELYYGFTEWMDNEIGKVLATLARGPFAGDTIVVYTTDHGENMGEHGLWWKNAVYEQAAHVPLIVNWPQRWKGGQRRAGACSLVDVVRTIAELGGGRAPADWNGDSMVKWMDDPGTRWKDMAVSQYYAHNIASGYAMFRAANWKYVYHAAPDSEHPAERELYNLDSDPMEFRNLAREVSEKQRVARMHESLVKELGGEDPEETERRCRAENARGYEGVTPGRKRNAKSED